MNEKFKFSQNYDYLSRSLVVRSIIIKVIPLIFGGDIISDNKYAKASGKVIRIKRNSSEARNNTIKKIKSYLEISGRYFFTAILFMILSSLIGYLWPSSKLSVLELVICIFFDAFAFMFGIFSILNFVDVEKEDKT